MEDLADALAVARQSAERHDVAVYVTDEDDGYQCYAWDEADMGTLMILVVATVYPDGMVVRV